MVEPLLPVPFLAIQVALPYPLGRRLVVVASLK